MDIAFYWIFVKPVTCVNGLPETSSCLTAVTDRVQDVDTVFSIDPDCGLLPAGKTASFMLTFAPDKVLIFMHNTMISVF